MNTEVAINRNKAKELTEILLTDPGKLAIMHEEGSLFAVLPELDDAFRCEQNNPYHMYSVGMHSIVTAENIEADPVLRWAAILHDLGKPATKTTDERGDHFYGHPAKSAEIAESILHKHEFTDEFISEVTSLIISHDSSLPSKRSIRRFVRKYSWELLDQHFKLSRADILAHHKDYVPELLAILKKEMELAELVRTEDPADNNKYRNLALKGQDLIEYGIPQGPEIGLLLDKAYDAIAEDPEKNTKEQLIELLFGKGK